MSDLPAPVDALSDGLPLQTSKGTLRSEMLKLVSGTVLAQLVALLATPIVTRLFPPDAYGVGVAFGSVSLVLLVFASLRYEQAIVLPADDKEAANVLGLSLFILALVTALVTFVFWQWGEVLMSWLRMPELIPYLWMVGPGLLVSGLLAVVTAWNIRTRSFGVVAGGHVLNYSGSTALRVLAGLTGHGTSGAMIGTNIIGSLITVLYQGALTVRSAGRLFREAIRPAGARLAAIRYVELPLFGTWAALFSTLASQLPVFLLAAFFSPAVVGQYALGNRIIKLPLSLLGDSISKVFLPRASVSAHEGKLAPLVETTYRRLVALGLPLTLLLLLSGRDLFALIFGAEWAEAGVYMQVLALWALARFVAGPLSNLTFVLERQRFFFIWTVINFAIQFAALWIGGMRASPLLALGLVSLSGTLAYGYLTVYVLRASGVPALRALAIFGAHIVGILPIAAVIFLLKWLGVPLWVDVGLPALLVLGYLIHAFRHELHVAESVQVIRGRLRKAIPS